MLNKYDYQPKTIENLLKSTHPKLGLFVAPGGGKTRMAAEYLNQILSKDKNKKHFIFTAGETYLRDQWYEEFHKFYSEGIISFKFKQVRRISDLNDKDTNVFILLPQFFNGDKRSLEKKKNALSKVNLGTLVVDEAHKRFQAKTYKNNILNLKWEKTTTTYRNRV